MTTIFLVISQCHHLKRLHLLTTAIANGTPQVSEHPALVYMYMDWLHYLVSIGQPDQQTVRCSPHCSLICGVRVWLFFFFFSTTAPFPLQAPRPADHRMVNQM